MVSIVVPVYNVEKYLKRCVESILSQTLRDIEIILVDDGSKDDSPRICDEYAKKDARIKVVHKKNGGLSSARNAGIKIATGQYIGFVDADDSVVPEMYEIMLQAIKREAVDFVMADYTRVLTNGTTYVKSADIREGRYDKEDIRKEIYPALIMGANIEYGPLLSVWHCLYCTDFLKKNNILFDEEVKWSEDNIFSAIVGYCAMSFYYLKGKAVYNYYQNEGTITTSHRPGAWNVYCTMNEHLRQYFANSEEYDFSQQFKWHSIYYACVCIGQSFSLTKCERKKVIKDILNSDELQEAFTNLDYEKMNMRLKVQLKLMKNKCCTAVEYLYMRRKV